MYRSLNAYLQEQFGCKVYKLALSGGMTCPNRDGTCGTRGCIFCSGSGEFAEKGGKSVTQQIEFAKKRVENKAKNAKYIAYFQDFTNTYASVEVLRPLFYEAIEHRDIAALSIATRPDCLPQDVLALLAELTAIKPVWVELGLQTIHEKTADDIRRGYPLSVYDEAVRKLRAIGVHIVTHMILGLPNESRQMMIETARYIGQSGSDGIKLHLLHVLRRTDLADEYEKGAFQTLEAEEYYAILADCLRVLPPQMVIHRLTGDGAKRDLIAPLWSADKKRVLNDMNRYFTQIGLKQGENL
ncbi:MAG: TIGR01212 family radical SAM protein [Oscillospiraceae bacterium]|nr:TIGR01212 family radical SAM protein [Oscillospiraceae bacterium]